MPSILKDIFASAYGYKLYRRRYGNKYFKDALHDIIERQKWNRDRLRSYQNERIRELIKIAANYVPYYRQVFQDLKLNLEDITCRRDVAEVLPILEKETLRKAPERLVDERINHNSLIRYFTSGTTGTPVCVYRDVETEAMAYAYYEARWRRPYGISKDSSWAMLGGKLIVPHSQNKPPFWVWNSGLNQLYMSSYHLSDNFMGYYLKELKKRKLDYIHGYASSLYSLALFSKNNNSHGLHFKVALSNAEPLYYYQRALIEDVFNCKVVNTYGCTEWCFQGSECVEKRLHISPDVSFLEVVDEHGNPAKDGEVGDVIATGLINFVQPLIRYRTGDSAIISSAQCSCGSSFPVLESVEGRTDDLVHLPDGRRTGRLDPLFKGKFPLVEAQIIQRELDQFTLKIVPGAGWDATSEEMLRKSCNDFLGNVNISIKKVRRIPRTKSGKFKAVISEISRI